MVSRDGEVWEVREVEVTDFSERPWDANIPVFTELDRKVIFGETYVLYGDDKGKIAVCKLGECGRASLPGHTEVRVPIYSDLSASIKPVEDGLTPERLEYSIDRAPIKRFFYRTGHLRFDVWIAFAKKAKVWMKNV